MRELCLEQFVDEIYEDSDKNEDSKYIFLLGAGCSKTSGIPLAAELAKEWYEELKKQKIKFEIFNRNNKIKTIKDVDYAKYYFKIFEELFPSPLAQQKEIQSRTENVIPALGYYVLADLMKEPSFNTVVTTNFDNLIQDAIIYSSSKRALVITHQDLARFIERNNTPLIVKVHGDAHMHPHNSEDGTQEIPKDLKSAIQGLFVNAKVICIGYGGNDKSIANLLEGCERIDQVYWLNGKKPDDVEVKKWWENLSNKTFIHEYDFDKIMHSIRRKFDIKKPNFKTLLDELESSYEQNRETETSSLHSKEKKSYGDYILLADNYFDGQEYKESINAYLDALELEKNHYYPNARLGYLYNLTNDSKSTEIYYKKALELEPNQSWVNGNYALFLNDIKQDYDGAEKHYKKALDIEPNAAEFNGNYALFLSHIKQDYDGAEKHYKKALDIEPNAADFNGNYALFLSHIKEDYEQAELHYKKALEIEPNDADFNGNYASFLFILGNSNEAEKYLEKAFQYSNNKNLDTELYFYKMAHLLNTFETSKTELDKLLDDGYKSKDWNFSQSIQRAIKDKHPHVDVLKEYATKISGLE